ncbi:MAG TPA: protease pro-enzyme activation domain-containing protein [Acidobacteriaceae bacterium]|nr:protease pro-enzyme activation domain-containing protein [Acidobacteriaceae bacterium]
MPDTVHPRARISADLGPAPAEMKLTGMSLRFLMTDAQSAALDQLLADQQDPHSPRFHEWLSPTEFADQFGLSQADITKVTSWLTAQGFVVTGVANSRTFVTFDGTVAQADAAFGTSIHNVSSGGEIHFANIRDATLPLSLAKIVGSITGLHNFHAHPHIHGVARPAFTSSISGSHYLAPGDLYAIYDMQPLLAGFTGAGIGTGANCHSVGGATCGDIAVVGAVDLTANNADVLAFRKAAGLSTTNLPVTVHEGGDPGPAQTCNNCYPNSGDLEESSLDVEWSGAMAPGATILFVNGPDVLANALTQAIDQNLAPIITNSYGNCEAAWGSGDLNTYNQLFKQASAQGQTILSAAGDDGATDCDAGLSAMEGLTVDFPASSPYVVAVGGTMFNEGDATGGTQYWLGTDTTFTAGSAVPSADVSAKGYIPEAVWNEDSAGNTFSATGGGVSAFFSKPTWQVETGAAGMTTAVPADGSRDLPDVSLTAAAVHDAFLFCAQSSCVNGFRTSTNNLTVAGGTSFDSQVLGGMLALIEQKLGSRLGNPNPIFYALGNQVAYYNNTSASVFHDVTTGNNSNPCTAGTADCPNGGSAGFSAGTGYDLATGWGSVDLNNLANAWTLVTPIGSNSVGTAVSSMSLTASSKSVTTGSSITLTALVGGSSGTPTGTVQFLDNNIALGSPIPLSGGVAIYTYNATCSTLGQQNMTAVYSGDSTYAGSKGPGVFANEAGKTGGATIASNGSVTTNPLLVTVTSSSCPDFTVTPSGSGFTVLGTNAAVSVAAGGTIPPLTISVSPTNGFTGTVSFSSSIVSTSGYTPAVTFSPASLTFASGSSTAQATTVALSGITAEMQPPAGALGRHIPFGSWYAAGSGATLASLLTIVLPRRRRLGSLLAVAVATVLVIGSAGCGGSSQPVSTGSSNTNPYIGTYTVTVMATYSNSGQSTTHSSTVTYTIN